MVKRLKTWLVIVSFLVALAGPVAVAGVNHLLDALVQNKGSVPLPPTEQVITEPPACVPTVDQSVFDGLESLLLDQQTDTAISLRMAELFTADQAVRVITADTPDEIIREDTARREEVLEYLRKGQLQTARDLVYAGFIFQHGDCSEHYLLANRLAEIAMDAGYPDAPWLYAASLDRYLMSLGQPQKFGTQYTFVNGAYQLYPVDPATTDEERAEYDVPSLEEALNNTPSVGSGQGTTRQSWLASWWLTLIGACFALLGAGIGFLDQKPNALPGTIVLIIAFVVYIASVVGHYIQINALMQGTYEVQQQTWGIVNIVMGVIWLIFAIMEAVRSIKARRNQPSNPGKHR
ncbi:MAG: hypothetical protein H0S79_11040 [Anaerolineaceae bacterium]|nr:hypothetical protein [Anaerolineaceae bacterium]